jgi:hypothetical protein
MPVRFIPNQPFIFESPIGEQSCLNNDDNAYAQIVQANDTVCVQVAIDPCDEAINCEPSMFAVGSDPGSSTTLGSGWSSSGGNYLFDGSGGVVGNISFTPLAPLVAGVPYQIMLDVNSVTGTCGIFVSLGIDTYATEITEAGSYRFYLICQTTADELVFTMNSLATTAGDTMSINNGSVSRVDFSQCWFDSLPFVYPSWDYTFDLTTLEGKFCSVTDFGDLTNTTAYINDGNYHRVNFTITEATHGGVEVILGGTYLGTTEGNGEFRYYGVPNDASGELILRKTDSFDGCISLCTVDEYGLVDNTDLGNSVYKLQVANSSGLATTDEIDFTVHDDRVTWCFDVSDLTNGGLPIELSCSIDYQLLLTAQCPEDSPTEYLSVTVLKYSNTTWDCTKVVEGYCDGYAYGFWFGSTTNNEFKLIQRLRVLQFAPRYPTEAEEYLFSSGVFGRSFGQRGKIRTAWFDYVDETAHDCISTQIICDVLKVDDDIYFSPAKDYEPEWDEHKRNLAQSRVDLIKADELTIFKRNC